MITNFKQFKESKLVPRNIDGRLEKLRQQNLRMLQQEVIGGDLEIDNSWNFKPEEVRIKKIIGHVELVARLGYIPEWFENVKITGDFNCRKCSLKTLKGCPKYVGGYFDCFGNELTTLEGCPEYVGGDFWCNLNTKQFTNDDIPKNTIIKGDIYF